jgi:hypothetical protein
MKIEDTKKIEAFYLLWDGNRDKNSRQNFIQASVEMALLLKYSTKKYIPHICTYFPFL